MAQEWGEKFSDFQGDTKQVFCNYLIWVTKWVESQLYMGGKVSLALKGIMGIVDCLDGKSQKYFVKLREKMQAWEDGKSYYRKDVTEAFQTVSKYLHQTYLKEINYARPRRPSKGFPGIPE